MVQDVGIPVVVRPSYVLGGRAMEVIRDEDHLDRYLFGALQQMVPGHIRAKYPNDKTGQINMLLGKNPLLFDRYLSQRGGGGRRCPVRRRGRVRLRRDGAHRGSRHPFGRLRPARCRRAR